MWLGQRLGSVQPPGLGLGLGVFESRSHPNTQFAVSVPALSLSSASSCPWCDFFSSWKGEEHLALQ